MVSDKIILTPEQESFILENWDKLPLIQLVKETFKDNSLDGRCFQAKVIKEFLADKKPKSTAWVKRPEIILSEENKEFVANNISLRPIEISRIIFNNPKIQPLSKEVLVVKKYKDSITLDSEKTDDMPEELYRPPSHTVQVVKKVNDFCQKDLKLETMPTVQRKAMESLKGFLHSPRFLHTINAYVSKKSRKVFEEEFVRATHDKPDLTPDELNLYVNLCSNYVLMITIQRQLDMLNERYESIMLDPDAKITTPFADMIAAKTTELNRCDKRQSELINDLNGKRSIRIKEQKGSTSNIANLFSWWKDEEERKKALQWAEIREKEVSAELDRLETIEEMKARILGISRSELLNG